MTWKRLKFALIVLLSWPVAIFIAGQIQPYASRAVWVLATKSGATTLSPAQFRLDSWLPLSFLEGFAFGLIPIQTLRRFLADSLARIRHSVPIIPGKEWDLSRPILWGWVLPTLFFLIRFALWGTHKSYSVLGESTTSAGPDRFAHFFASPDAYILLADPTVWFNDRFFLTVPMLFTLAYTLAVFLRDHMPRQPATTLEPTPEPADPIPADTLGS